MSDAPATPPGERLHVLDILRGLALLGMILVHFRQKMELEVEGPEGLIGWIIWIGFEQKSWGTFAFLFGVGFAILLRRLESRNAPILRTYLRRLAGLAVFGIIAQACFGFRILLEYAIWGVPLLLIRNWSYRALLATAFVAVAFAPLGYLAMEKSESFAALLDKIAFVGEDELFSAFQAQKAAEGGDDYLRLLAARSRMLRLQYLHWEAYLPSTSFALFIVGLIAVRRSIFDAPRSHVPLILGTMAFGLISWGFFWLGSAYAPEDLPWAARTVLGLVQDQWLCFTYIGAVVLLCAWWPIWLKWLSPLGIAGRMALTNYMAQIAVLDFLASGYGMALQVRPIGSLLGTAMLFGCLVAFSYLWLWRFRLGPLEWIWRCVTYSSGSLYAGLTRTATPRPPPRSAGVVLHLTHPPPDCAPHSVPAADGRRPSSL